MAQDIVHLIYHISNTLSNMIGEKEKGFFFKKKKGGGK